MDPPKMSFKEVKKRTILQGLRALKAPAVIGVLVTSIFAIPSLKWGPGHELDHLELFAGQCSVTRGEFQEGRTSSVAMDLDHNPETMNMLTNTGFVSALYHATCLRPGSGCLAAPVCSSFVYMNSGTARRSESNPYGQECYESVLSGNEEISQLGEFKPRTKSTQTISLVDHYYDADGNRRVKGNGNLKASQAYPLGFGVALAKLRTRHAKENRRRALRLIKQHARKSQIMKRCTRKDGLWLKCANLNPVLEFLA
ncbi:unnamed protein product [Cladocopium goreaui]|uniref:Uncharacterized protein n=1 Tax=Cladocopium goreaui TaxID=2562237 RepID=A0A9P1C9Y8_9DINO|nr:unnamed protein product [Cladocopium goreaui]